MSNLNASALSSTRTAPPRSGWTIAPVGRPVPANLTTPTPKAPAPATRVPAIPAPPATPLPRTLAERMILGRERIRAAAEAGLRIRSYEVALDLDFSEFHFARQFRAAFGTSPHAYYNDIRAERARVLLSEGLSESEAARRVGFRRPAELRALLTKRAEGASTDGDLDAVTATELVGDARELALSCAGS
jgi:AraC-like DNA-binding protein